jgi:Coenzyme PQQ synthesis protein D (PqqD)
MIPTIPGEAVLKQTSWCTVREQEDRYLVYNPQTDELHLIPPTGFYTYALCDGARTVGEVQAVLADQIPADRARLQSCLHRFLADLIARGILEVSRDS